MKDRLRNIDLLKGLLISIVIIEHAGWSFSQWRKGLFPYWDRIAIPFFMVISGFVYTKSIERKSFTESYNLKEIIRKAKRYLLPFSVIYFLELLVYFVCGIPQIQNFLSSSLHYHINHDPWHILTFKNITINYLNGGYGPGNYYTPLMIQFILLFPLLYLLIKKYKFKGLLFSALSCLVFEFLQYVFKIPNSIYRLLIFRHLFSICFGIYYALGLYRKNKPLNAISLLIGFVYITMASYIGYVPPFFNSNWADVNFIACFFYIPIIAFFLSKQNLAFTPLEKIGKASFHIYLIQMIYYHFAKKELFMRYVGSQALWCLFNLLLCISLGLIFYELEKKTLQSGIT